jgi:hypothetical protein
LPIPQFARPFSEIWNWKIILRSIDSKSAKNDSLLQLPIKQMRETSLVHSTKDHEHIELKY